ncbi:MAG: tRNA (cytidine(56)-2'-O)-methyltransferase [Thermoproteota archaeon]
MEKYSFEVGVLRLGHRVFRDKRVTMHAFLVSRAFGASVFIIHGDRDSKLEENARKIVSTWGGRIRVEYAENWLDKVRKWKEEEALIVHLTMYGMPVEKMAHRMEEADRILVIIGGQKVPKEAYMVSDYNVSVTNQPHSEIAALAIFLDRLFKGRELYMQHQNPRILIVPSPRGKVIFRNLLYRSGKRLE